MKMKRVVLMIVLGGLSLVGCKKAVVLDLGLELGEQITILEMEWVADPKGERGKLGVPVRLTNPTGETVQVSELKLDIHSEGKLQCGETKALERTIEPGGKIKMRLDIVCHWDDLASGFRAEGSISVDSDSGEPATLVIDQAGLRVHK
jgi:hypothetical protein